MHRILLACGFLALVGCTQAAGSGVASAAATTSDAAGADLAAAHPDVAADPGMTLEEFVAATYAAACKSLVGCAGDNNYRIASQAGCIALVTDPSWCEITKLVAGVKAGTIHFDGVKAAACVATLSGCPMPHHDSEACVAAFTGLVPDGGACKTDFACASTRCNTQGGICAGVCASTTGSGGKCATYADCRQPLDCRAGTCAAALPAQIGQACDGPADCASGLRCAHTDNSAICKALVGLDAPCEQRDDCAHGLYCPPGSNGSLACKPRLALGAACQGGADVAGSGQCQEGTACIGDEKTATCQALAFEGAPCAATLQCFGNDLACVPDANGQGVCRVLPGMGKACAAAGDAPLRCLKPLVCVAGFCADPPGLGMPCAEDGSCDPALLCDKATGTCLELPDVGLPCSADQRCRQGAACKVASGGSSGSCVAAVCH